MSFPFLIKTEHMSNEIIILGERTKQASKCLSIDNQEVEIVKASYVPGYFTSSNLYIVCEHVDYIMNKIAHHHPSLEKLKMLGFQ